MTATEVQKDTIYPPRKDGIEQEYINSNPIINNVLRMVRRGDISQMEGLYMMINGLAKANNELMRIAEDCIKSGRGTSFVNEKMQEEIRKRDK